MQRPFGLTNRELLLIHLLDQAASRLANPIPNTTTQEGIAKGTDVPQANLSRICNQLVEEGAIEETLDRVEGGTRKRKVYWLTDPGTEAANEILKELGQRRIPDPEHEGERRKIQDLLEKEDGRHHLPRIRALALAYDGDPGEKPTPAPSPQQSESFRVAGLDEVTEMVLGMFGPEAHLSSRDRVSRFSIRDGPFRMVGLSIHDLGGEIHMRFRPTPLGLWPLIPALALSILIIRLLPIEGFLWALPVLPLLLAIGLIENITRFSGAIRGAIMMELHLRRWKIRT